ncbi:MAG: YkgJ family cysteine cluster protein [Planctomycetes bacterium]|nr:YkgJ family cysteine cluster protein [Planctomycetota bacterium]
MIQPPAPKPEPAEQETSYKEPVAEMVRHLETVRDLPGLGQFRETRALRRAFFEHFNAFLACYDRLIDFALEFSSDDRKIHCKKGCANCCIDLVRGLSTPEIVNIYHHVRPWPDAKQLFEYHRDSAEQFSYILLNMVPPGEEPPGGQDPRIVAAHMEYNLLKRPCGFLDQETGCCRIYPVRPLACRYFFSLDAPEMCTPTHEKYFRRNTRNVHLPEQIHALLREIDHAFGFRPLNYLSGAFCQFTAQTMRIKLITVLQDGNEAGT